MITGYILYNILGNSFGNRWLSPEHKCNGKNQHRHPDKIHICVDNEPDSDESFIKVYEELLVRITPQVYGVTKTKITHQSKVSADQCLLKVDLKSLLTHNRVQWKILDRLDKRRPFEKKLRPILQNVTSTLQFLKIESGFETTEILPDLVGKINKKADQHAIKLVEADHYNWLKLQSGFFKRTPAEIRKIECERQQQAVLKRNEQEKCLNYESRKRSL
ncbi:15986_t:CDS:2 [Funneliformis geosporum]|nr:15986_t:CDS:2 [Funneliformis geosporum]